MKKKLKRLTSAMLVLVLFAVQFILPAGSIRSKAITLSNIGMNAPMSGWSVPVNAQGNTYTLHVWISDSRMGEWQENAVYHKGIMHFMCYELTNNATGEIADDIDFEAECKIWDPDGEVAHEVTYSTDYTYHDDYGTEVSPARNYIGRRAYSTGKWKGNVSVTGDITVDVSVYWNITVPYVNLHVWVSDTAMGSAHGGSSDPFLLNDTSFLCYELTDLDNGCQLDGDVTGFDAHEIIYCPDGSKAYEYSYDSSMGFQEGYSMAYNWISTPCSVTGQWHGVVTLSGDIDLTLEVYWTVVEDGTVIPTEPPASSDDHFIWGQDNWNFDNHDGYFIYSYYVNNKMLDALSADCGLTNVDKELLRKNAQLDSMGQFGGACYGITMSEILAKDGRLDLTRYGGNKVVNRNENTEDMLSLANFMYELQNVPCMNQVPRQSYMQGVTEMHTQDEFMRTLETAVQTGDGLINLCFGIGQDGGGMHGFHSILAYGVESGSWTVTYKNRTRTFDRRILIADPNYLTQNYLYDDACVYYSSKDYSWVIPAYNWDGVCCYWDASFGSSEPCGYLRNIIRHTGMKQYTDLMLDTPDAIYLPGLVVHNSSQSDPRVRMIEGTGNPNLGDGKVEPYYITGDEYAELNDYYWTALGNPTASYEIYDTSPASFECVMDYEDVAFITDVTRTTNMYFNPKGQVELKGSGAGYSISIVTNKERCVTDWYSVQISGDSTSKLLYAVVPDGYVVRGDNLQNMDIYAFNNDDYAYLHLSTKYTNILVHEISPTVIGISVDQDNDGNYETLIAQGEPHEWETDPTDPPTEPITEPTEPVTEPTEPVTEPTEPPTVPPTEPVTEPTEPPTAPPTEPVTEPTELPTAPPTEPVTEPTELPTEPVEQGLVLQNAAVILQCGEQFQIVANKTGLTYSSSNPKVAIVSPTGLVTALTNGTATITVFDEVYNTAQLIVTVQEQADPMPAYALGDVDGNSIINASDAARILIAAASIGAGKGSGLTAKEASAADVNYDTSINSSDAAAVLRFAAYAGAGGTLSFTSFLASPPSSVKTALLRR